jgi:hypothetical protein
VVRCRSSDRVASCGCRKSKEAKKRQVSLSLLSFCVMLSTRCGTCYIPYPYPKALLAYGAPLGNKASSSAQAFFIQFGIVGSFYNAALALYFYKSLCSSMKDEQIAKMYEKWIHIVSLELQMGLASKTYTTAIVVLDAILLPSRFDATEETMPIVFKARMHTYTYGCTWEFL